MAKSKKKAPEKRKEEAPTPELSPVDSESDEENSGGSDEDSVYDSADEYERDPNNNINNEDSEEEDESEDEFEDQGSSDEDEDLNKKQQEPDDDSDNEEIDLEENLEAAYEKVPRQFTSQKKTADGKLKVASNSSSSKNNVSGEKTAKWMHTDDLSSDEEDEDGKGNRIGRVPLHWYEDYDHIGYDAHGSKVVKSASAQNGDRLDQAIAQSDQMEEGNFVVHDALNDRNVTLTSRQLELIRRVQAGAFAHPEFDGTPDYIDYYSGVQEISGLNSNRYESKARFQPSQWEKLQVDRLLEKLEKGDINMDYLTGKVRDMNDVRKKKEGEESDKPYLLWKGDEEDLIAMRKGPQHIAPPKVPPPGHAESYRPPDEYLPTEEDLKEWEELEVKDRPHGRLVPKKFPNLRSVGAYEHTVTDTFERCLDLYLCPRFMKRKLNIDPESLVPKLPKASDLRPFPTAKCIEYKTEYEGETPPLIRCLSPSPDGQFLASGSSDGVVRLWEVQTSRLLRSWNLSNLIRDVGFVGDMDDQEATKPIVCLQWNPNRSHHCLIAGVGACVIIIATGTAGEGDAELTTALLAAAAKGGNVTNEKAAKAVEWKALSNEGKEDRPISAYDDLLGPVAGLKTNREVASLRWHAKGDYFVSVSPKAGASSVLIHQLSKGNSQQPFSKTKGEPQLACFHPNKPFLFVSSQHHIRIYHLVKQAMVKRLISGCRWISSLDIHPTGDHLIVGSLDRRLMWFDLDLSSSPFKTLKYHERGLRSVQYHSKYPLMASSSDDGTIHVFHSMVYSDLMKNPLIVPVKILRGHEVTKKLGVLSVAFHPTQPWLFSGGADGRIFLYQDI